MAFGKQTALAALAAERRMDREQPQADPGAGSTAPPPQPAAASSRPSSTRPPQSRPTAAFGRPQVSSRPPAPVPADSVAPAPASSQRPASTHPGVDRDPMPPTAQPTPVTGGYVRQLRDQAARTEGLSLALERLIDEACDFMGLDDARRAAQKTRALSNPKEWEERLRAFYEQTIRPARANTAQTLGEGRRKHPGKVVFMSVEGSKASLEVLDPDTPVGQEQAILDGAVVELMVASRTPFAPPAELFGRARAEQALEASQVDEAFQVDVSSPPGTRPRRPA